jgi:hypothetical protein
MVKDMDMMGIHMVEVEDMKMVEQRPSNHRSEVEDMNREENDIGEDMTVEVEVVEREHRNVVLTMQWTDDGVDMHQRSPREREELVMSDCSKGHTTFISQYSNYLT